MDGSKPGTSVYLFLMLSLAAYLFLAGAGGARGESVTGSASLPVTVEVRPSLGLSLQGGAVSTSRVIVSIDAGRGIRSYTVIDDGSRIKGGE